MIHRSILSILRTVPSAQDSRWLFCTVQYSTVLYIGILNCVRGWTDWLFVIPCCHNSGHKSQQMAQPRIPRWSQVELEQLIFKSVVVTYQTLYGNHVVLREIDLASATHNMIFYMIFFPILWEKFKRIPSCHIVLCKYYFFSGIVL